MREGRSLRSKDGGVESQASSDVLVITVLAISQVRRVPTAVTESATLSSLAQAAIESLAPNAVSSAETAMRGRERGQAAVKTVVVSLATPRAICHAVGDGVETRREVAAVICLFGLRAVDGLQTSVARKTVRRDAVGPAEANNEGLRKGHGPSFLHRSRVAASGRREASGGRGLSTPIGRRLRPTRAAPVITLPLEVHLRAITAGEGGRAVICAGRGLGPFAMARATRRIAIPVTTADCH